MFLIMGEKVEGSKAKNLIKVYLSSFLNGSLNTSRVLLCRKNLQMLELDFAAANYISVSYRIFEPE